MRLVSLKFDTDLVTNEDSVKAVILDDGGSRSVSIESSHPNYGSILDSIEDFKEGVIAGDELAELLVRAGSLESMVEEKISTVRKTIGLDGRLTVANGRVFIDHEPIDRVLEGHILRLLREDGSPKDTMNWGSFIKFVENLYGNQSAYVREQLFGWLQYENTLGHGFTLTPDGCLIGYKGCAGTPENPVSVFSGYAIVDGVDVRGQIPNNVGSVIEMPRSQVTDDPAVGCAVGLHVGTYGYAKDWARGVLLTVKVNPRDVVSVPTEVESQKIRVCRYDVLEAVDGPITEASWSEWDNDWEEEYFSYEDSDLEDVEDEETPYEDCECDPRFEDCSNCDDLGEDDSFLDKVLDEGRKIIDFLKDNTTMETGDEVSSNDFLYEAAKNEETVSFNFDGDRVVMIALDFDGETLEGYTVFGRSSYNVDEISEISVTNPMDVELVDFTLKGDHLGFTYNGQPRLLKVTDVKPGFVTGLTVDNKYKSFKYDLIKDVRIFKGVYDPDSEVSISDDSDSEVSIVDVLKDVASNGLSVSLGLDTGESLTGNVLDIIGDRLLVFREAVSNTAMSIPVDTVEDVEIHD